MEEDLRDLWNAEVAGDEEEEEEYAVSGVAAAAACAAQDRVELWDKCFYPLSKLFKDDSKQGGSSFPNHLQLRPFAWCFKCPPQAGMEDQCYCPTGAVCVCALIDALLRRQR